MDDDDDQILRDKVESSRKRKYLKSASFGVPKRTREHWNKKEKGIATTESCEMLEQSFDERPQQDLHSNDSPGRRGNDTVHSLSDSEFVYQSNECAPNPRRQLDLLGSNNSPICIKDGTRNQECESRQKRLQGNKTKTLRAGICGSPNSSPDPTSSSSSSYESDSDSESRGDFNSGGSTSSNSSRSDNSCQEDGRNEERQEQTDRSDDAEEQCQEENEIYEDEEADEETYRRGEEEAEGERESDGALDNEENRDHEGNENDDQNLSRNRNNNNDQENSENEERQELGDGGKNAGEQHEEENEINEGDETDQRGEEEMEGNRDNDGDSDNEENRDQGNENNGQNPRRNNNHNKLWEYIETPPNNENITTPVDLSRIDMLYMALGLARQNNFTNKAFNDAVKLLNTIFTTPVLPRSSYLLDQLIMSYAGIRFFFFCGECFHLFGELDFDHIKEEVCPTCDTVNPISDLRIANYFCLFDLKCQLEVLLSDETLRQSICTPSEAVAQQENGFFSDVYSGSMYKKFAATLGQVAERVVSFQLNTDGSPLFQSSKCSIWPISLALNELSPALRMKNILIGGLWFGKKKPPMDLFLEPFVNQMCTLSHPFNIKAGNEVWSMRAYVIGVSVDSGARGAVQGLKTHSGYDSCSWCFIHGEYLAGAVRFPLTTLVPKQRCHADIIKLQYDLVNEDPQSESDISEDESIFGHGVNAVSPLINLPGFDMVEGFYVEGMHLLHLGITRNAIRKWCEDYDQEYYVKDFEVEINRRIRSLRPPEDCRRMPRTLDEKPRYKARELENFLLFCIIPVLTGILPDRYLKMWLLFAQAVYLLSLAKTSHSQINTADILLKKFMVQWQEAYGNASMNFNCHIIYHLAEHVSRWGNIWASSAYCFEAFNGELKKVIKSQQGIPNQVIRSLSWQQAMQILETQASQKAKDFVRSISASKSAQQKGLRVGDNSVLLGKPKPNVPTDEELYLWQNEGIDTDVNSVEVYKKLLHKKTVYAPDSARRKTNNSVAQLNDKTLVLIRKILFDRIHSQIYLLVSSVHFETLLEVPAEVSLEPSEHLMRRITFVEPNSRFINCEELNIICFRATLPHVDYVAPLPNVMNRC